MTDQEEIDQCVSLSIVDAKLLEQATVSFLRFASRSRALGSPLISDDEARRLHGAVLQLQAQLVRCRQPDPVIQPATLCSSSPS